MNYLERILIWCMINIPLTFIAFRLNKNFLFSIIFFIGFFIILIFGVLEIKKKSVKEETNE